MDAFPFPDAEALTCPFCDCPNNHFVSSLATTEDMHIVLACEDGHNWALRLHSRKGTIYIAYELIGKRDSPEIPDVFLR